MKDELEMLRLIVDAEKKKVRDSETEISKLNVDLKKEKVEKKGIQENYEKIKGEMEKMIDSDKLQRGLLENENLEMRSTVHKLRESINQLEEKLLEAQRQKPDPVDENEVERLRQDNTNLIEELRRNMDEIMELEKLKNLRVDIEERDAEIERLKEEIDSMKSKLNLQDDLMEDEFKKKNDLGGKVNSLNQEKELLKKKLEKQESDRKKLNETLKKRDTDLEEKENDLRKAMESFSNLKDTNLKLRTTIEKLSKEKEDFAKKLDRVLNDLSLMKKSRDEAQDLHSRMQEEYLTFKDQLTKKDEWILKQGNEMKLVSDQYNNIKKKYLDYKNDIEAGRLGLMFRVRESVDRQEYRDHGSERNDQKYEGYG